MIEVTQSGSLDLTLIENFLFPELAGKVTARISGKVAAYLRNTEYAKFFENRTGETRESIQNYRAPDRNAAYFVKAGVGIPGSLNYMAGLYKGSAKSRSGKTFQYKQPRPLLKGAKQLAESYAAAAWDKALDEVIPEAERKMK